MSTESDKNSDTPDSPKRTGKWKLVCRDGHSFSAILYDPDGNVIPLIRDLLISVDATRKHTEILFTQYAGVNFHSPRVEECIELDLEFKEDIRVKVLRKPAR